MVMRLPVEGEMKNVTVSRTKSGKYFVSIQAEVEITEPVFVGGAVGLDLGLRDFATLSSREKIAPPHYYRKAQQQRRRFAHHHLAKFISDVGWSAFIGMLVYKSDRYGCRVEKVNR